MFLGAARGDRKRPTRDDYEHEAAMTLATRVAEGRPPPDVWRQAEARRSQDAHPRGWYTPVEPSARDRLGHPLVLRRVRIPVATD